ncbi:CDK5 regulatory subunit-associated protein 1 isoform X1, partial [Tachysurus ichikawai]
MLSVAMIQCIRSSGWTGYMLIKIRHNLPEVKVPNDDSSSVRMFVDVAIERIVKLGQSQTGVSLCGATWTATRHSGAILEKELTLQFPTDPAHVDQLKIQVNSDYIQFCCSLGPSQPAAGFPKNPEGRSFQSQWYAGNKWLECSLEKDAMYCFSCRLFLTEDKFKSRTAWRTSGVVNWWKAVEKIHEHSATEAHMISMVRWANYRKGPLVEAFKAQAAECGLQNEKERQKNIEILFRLIDITVYLATEE